MSFAMMIDDVLTIIIVQVFVTVLAQKFQLSDIIG